MTRVLVAVDQARAQDESGTWQRIAKGLQDAGMEQIHLLAPTEHRPPPAPLLQDVEVLTLSLIHI